MADEETSSGDKCFRSTLSRSELHEFRALGKQSVHFNSSREGWTRSLEQFPSSFSLSSIQQYLVMSGQNVIDNEEIHRYWLHKGNQMHQSHNCKQVELRYRESFVIARSFVERSQTARDSYAAAVYIHKSTAMPIGAYCHCPARNSETCSHAIGLLFYLLDSIEKAASLPPEARLLIDDVVATDVPQVWHKPAASRIDPVPLSQFPLQQSSPGNIGPTHSLSDPTAYYGARVSGLNQQSMDTFMNTLMVHEPTVPFASHLIAQRTHQLATGDSPSAVVAQASGLRPQQPLPLPLPIFEAQSTSIRLDSERVDRIRKAVVLSPQEASDLEIRTRTQNLNPDWMRERKLRITASEFGSIISLTRADPTKKAESLAQIGHGFMSRAMQQGIERESAIAQRAFEQVQGTLGGIPGKLIKSTGLLVNPDMPHLGASLDGLMVFEGPEPLLFPLEVKYAASESSLVDYAKKTSTFLVPNGDGVSLKPNSKWFHQTQGQLAVSGLSEGYFAIEASSESAGLGEFHIEKTTLGDWSQSYEKLTNFYFNHYLKVIE